MQDYEIWTGNLTYTLKVNFTSHFAWYSIMYKKYRRGNTFINKIIHDVHLSIKATIFIWEYIKLIFTSS